MGVGWCHEFYYLCFQMMQTLQFWGIRVLCAHLSSPKPKAAHVLYVAIAVLTGLEHQSSLGVNRKVWRVHTSSVA